MSMRDRPPQPFTAVVVPPRYAEPDWDADAVVARVWVPEEPRTGWLIRQGDALTFLSTIGPPFLGAYIRRSLHSLLSHSARVGLPVDEAWTSCLAVCWSEPPETRSLKDVLAEARSQWTKE